MVFRRRLIVLGLVVATAALAYGVPAGQHGPAPLKGYSSDTSQNLFGYYMPPADSVRFGKYVLRNIALGEPADFRKYESGKNDVKTYAPLMLEFDDTSSQKKQGEMGEYYANAPRVLPSAYRIAGSSIAFAGTHRELGTVSFTGTLDRTAIKASQNGGSLEATVLTGDVTVGSKTIKQVKFTWFGGD
jgi:hypothetical protein